MGAGAIGAGVGAGLGLINHNQAKGKYNREKELAAQIEANSAYTGQHARDLGVNPQDPGSAFQAALGGAWGGMQQGKQFGGGTGGPAAAAAGAAAPAAGAAVNPMAGAETMGAQPGMSAMGKQQNQGNSMFAGGGSSWGGVPTMYGQRQA